MTRIIVLLAAVLLTASLPALAVDDRDDTPPARVQSYVDGQRELRAQVQSSKRYAHMSRFQRDKLLNAQDRLFATLEGKEYFDQLTPDELKNVRNLQQQVRAILADAELDRDVCERNRKTGTQIATTRCRSVRERDRERFETEETLLNPPSRVHACSGPGGSTGSPVCG